MEDGVPTSARAKVGFFKTKYYKKVLFGTEQINSKFTLIRFCVGQEHFTFPGRREFLIKAVASDSFVGKKLLLPPVNLAIAAFSSKPGKHLDLDKPQHTLCPATFPIFWPKKNLSNLLTRKSQHLKGCSVLSVHFGSPVTLFITLLSPVRSKVVDFLVGQ